MWLTHFWHSWSQFFIFAWDVTAGGILRTGVLICLVVPAEALAMQAARASAAMILTFSSSGIFPLNHHKSTDMKSLYSSGGKYVFSVAEWCHMATRICVNIGSGNGLLPDGTKPLPEPNLSSHQWDSVAFALEQCHSKCPCYYSVYI